MKIKGGIKEAAKLLEGLTGSNRKRVLEIIAKENRGIAIMLEKEMVSLEDLKLLSVKMLRELLSDISIIQLATAMRISSVELREYISSNLSKGLALEFNEILNGPPVPVNKVQEASDNVLNVLRKKIDKGEIVLSKDDDPLV